MGDTETSLSDEIEGVLLEPLAHILECLSSTDCISASDWQATYLCNQDVRDALMPPPLADPSKPREPLEPGPAADVLETDAGN